MKLKFFRHNLKKKTLSNFMKIRQVGDTMFHADGRTDMTKRIVAFRNSANAHKNGLHDLSVFQLLFVWWDEQAMWQACEYKKKIYTYFNSDTQKGGTTWKTCARSRDNIKMNLKETGRESYV